VLAYLNGQYQPRSAATISVEDRGFIFGDGVYEVWRVVNGVLFETDAHLDRLRFGLRELRISEPEIVSAERLSGVADRLLTESGLESGEATLYVEITRGAAPRVHQFPPPRTQPTVYVTVNRFSPPEELRARGAEAITLPDVRWLRCDIKTLQLLPNVLAKQAAVEVGAVDSLLIRNGRVTESSHANVLGVRDGVIHTHPTNHLILPGITRAIVIDIARAAGIHVVEEPFAESDIPQMDELFLAGTTTDVMPLVRVNGTAIGDGTPGPIARLLQTEFRARLDAACSASAPAAESRTA
jgi:D-alanine transaminase